MEHSISRIHDAEDPSDPRARAHSEFGIRSSEFGVRNSEFGIRNSEFGIRSSEFGVQGSESGVRNSEFVLRNGYFPSPRASVKEWDGTFDISDSRCGRSFGLEGLSPFGIRNSFFGMDSLPAPEKSEGRSFPNSTFVNIFPWNIQRKPRGIIDVEPSRPGSPNGPPQVARPQGHPLARIHGEPARPLRHGLPAGDGLRRQRRQQPVRPP